MYNAPSSGTGSATVDATASSMTGSAAVSIAPNPAAPTNLTATVISPATASHHWSRRRVAVDQPGGAESSKGEPPSASCTCRRAIIQRTFTVGTAMPNKAAASACDIS